jgi:menaquinone-dependent protoporphyrinogen oxidase
MRVLVTFASKHGSTREVAQRIAARLDELGAPTDVRPMSEVEELNGYDGVVIGSSVYFGHWMKEATAFVERIRPMLTGRSIWLFSTGPLRDQGATNPPEIAGLAAALPIVEHRLFGGAMSKSRLSFLERTIVKGVRAPFGDFRDWKEIDAWAATIAQQLKEAA